MKQADKAFKRHIKARAQFSGLSVVIADGVVYRDKPFAPLELLGPARGATAVVLPYRAHRLGAALDASAVLGPAGLLLGMGRKQKAQTVVALANGRQVTGTVEGGAVIRSVIADAAVFNAVANAPGLLTSVNISA